jgi:hypothetical protein
MHFSRIIGTGAFLALCAALSYAQDSSSGITITPYGWAALDFGEVVKGYDKHAGNLMMVEFNRIFLRIGLNVHFNDRTNLTGAMDVKTFNEFPRLVKLGATRRYYYYLYLHQAELVHTFFDNDVVRWDLGGGYFPYKYNNNVRNLGEYLFRSTAYPQTLTTEFDMPWNRLFGVYSKHAFQIGENKLNVDALATLNTEWVAIGDLNASVVATYARAHFFEIGAGVEFGSIVSADEKTTTPQDDNTKYFLKKSDGTVDTSQYYTFRGAKLMTRTSFDCKYPLPFRSIFGEEDLKLYGEWTFLGTKSYPRALHSPMWYNSPLERMPVMAGFNLPTFKILDVLSLEGEYWANRYPNSMEGIVNDGLPLPFLAGTSSIDSTKYKKDNWKWSIYAAKTFLSHYRLVFQAASDHMRTFAWDWNRQDWEESLRDAGKWYFVLRFSVMF